MSASTSESPNLNLDVDLGKVAVFNDLLAQEQVDECLAIQADLAKRGYPLFLGRLLIQKHYLDRVSIAAIVKAIAAERGVASIDVDTRINLLKLTEEEHRVLLTRARQGKLLTVEQVDQAYDIQIALERHGIDEQLGEILVAKSFLSREVIEDILAGIQAAREEFRAAATEDLPPWTEPGQATPTEPPAPTATQEAPAAEHTTTTTTRRILFGELAIEKKLITADQLDKALAAQARMRELGVQRRLGEVLIARKQMRPPDVRRILSLQKERYGRISHQDASKTQARSPADLILGRVLLEKKLLSQEELQECQYIQKELQELGVAQSLGEILVEHGYLEAEIVQGIYRHQSASTGRAAPESAGPVQIGQRLKSSALSDCYKQVLKDLGIEEAEADKPAAPPAEEGEARGIVRTGRLHRARRSAVLERPKLALTAVGILLAFAAVSVVGWLATRTPPEEARPVGEDLPVKSSEPEIDPLVGKRIRFRGVVPAGFEVAVGPRPGTLLVNRLRFGLWVEDQGARWKKEFEGFRDRLALEDRVCLEVEGTVEAAAAGKTIPAQAKQGFYLRLTSVKELPAEEYLAASEHLELLEEGAAPAGEGK